MCAFGLRKDSIRVRWYCLGRWVVNDTSIWKHKALQWYLNVFLGTVMLIKDFNILFSVNPIKNDVPWLTYLCIYLCWHDAPSTCTSSLSGTPSALLFVASFSLYLHHGIRAPNSTLSLSLIVLFMGSFPLSSSWDTIVRWFASYGFWRCTLVWPWINFGTNGSYQSPTGQAEQEDFRHVAPSSHHHQNQ